MLSGEPEGPLRKRKKQNIMRGMKKEKKQNIQLFMLVRLNEDLQRVRKKKSSAVILH